MTKEQEAKRFFETDECGVIYVCDCSHVARYHERTNGVNCPKCDSDKLLSRQNRFERGDV